MAYQNLQQFIAVLEREGELVRIAEYVNPELEITEITDRISKNNGPALLFENTGYAWPLLINALGSEKRMCLALGVQKLDEIGDQIEDLFHTLSEPKNSLLDKIKLLPQLGKIASWMPKIKKGRGACQAFIDLHPDITQLPVMKCWPEDGGRFLTLPIIHTIDPETHIRNVGLYRMQVLSKNATGMHWHKHKVSAGHFNKYKQLHKKMPVAVALGGDPVYTYAATAPLPPNVDEYVLAGFIRKQKVELVKCITQDMYVPEDADFIIEGYVDPDEALIMEGPFGDHTGYYSLADLYPAFHITCITHKKDPVYPSTIVGIPPQEDAWIGKATERIFLTPIKMTLIPEMVDMHMPIEGVFHNVTLVKIKKEFAGQAQKVMNAMWGAGQMMFNKMLVIADDKPLANGTSLNLNDYAAVARCITQNTDPVNDIYLSQGPMDVLDHSCSKFAFGGKMCIDATHKYDEEKNALARPDDPGQVSLNPDALRALDPAIHGINDSLLQKGISVLCISVEKNKPQHIQLLHEAIIQLPGFSRIKFFIYVDHLVNVGDLSVVIWHFANNIDPKRDVFLSPHNAEGHSHCGIDGTRKTKQFDHFSREWPNVIIMDDATIQAIDEKWDKLGLGPWIKSPSLKFKSQVLKGGAVVEE